MKSKQRKNVPVDNEKRRVVVMLAAPTVIKLKTRAFEQRTTMQTLVSAIVESAITQWSK